MIELLDVSKDYGTTHALRGVSITIPRGQVTVLIGPSGCGKTTFLRVINRLVTPTAGKVLIDGQDNTGIKSEDLRRGIGYAIQGVGLFPHWTVAGNIATVPKLIGWQRERIEKRVRELLELVGLSPKDYANRYPAELSGGQAQRVGVARALAADPPILLMDEPFGAVDPLTRIRLQNEFMRIQSRLKKTVIFVTHDLEEAIRLADRIAIMAAGEIVQYDTPENILSKPANKYVHDFVGTDRALKRLSRFKVADFVKQTSAIRLSDIDKITAQANRFSWIIGDRGEFKGWLDETMLGAGNPSDAVVIPQDDFALPRDASLRQALSIMLGQGVRALPVVDESGIFLGEVTLADVEKATTDSKAA
ncbi:ABC transporter ATP-binding protein [Dehalogenimonas etheniformans]|uniref:ABC-type quaternary amine transporter n=1 Tax=Dehalogenimonas etheniformans TaxID=1536648 RepID=A0A2P5P884_9CHLR|nr:ABC transporter ATP-binding protein [Dehalogenimonas etheniformans]PPD58512.1 ABC transporter ATP-binding protein [Dehalogenimonas etheniformans]QNT76724.1 ABC transporter ATP-binding protein [Dehalogenimonas etheniformans]